MKYMVATDGSAHAKRAINMVLKFKKDDDSLVILAIGEWEEHRFSLFPEDERIEQKKKVLEATEKLVNNTMQELADKGVKNVSGKAEVGHPRDVIVNEAAVEKVDLLVLGNRGLGMVKRMLMGSVSDYVMKNASCNVLIAKEKVAAPTKAEAKKE